MDRVESYNSKCYFRDLSGFMVPHLKPTQADFAETQNEAVVRRPLSFCELGDGIRSVGLFYSLETAAVLQ